ncbi:hypothetical protein [Streptomyces sp. Tu 3180]|uniref:hypothetical protein n=1 Tax=Streptomyces sp. Tu 3180 TaxID=2682611 RepID=UPI00135858FF|nr:hypothetical protein GL259_36560 [Streptomyces sp. Tu 3180]
MRLAYAGLLTAADVGPVASPHAALALLDEGSGDPERAWHFAADPDVEHRVKPAARPGLPAAVREMPAADPDVRVVAELASWTTADLAARLARHPRAEVRRAAAADKATPPSTVLEMTELVLQNPATPVEAVVRFADHPSMGRCHVVGCVRV